MQSLGQCHHSMHGRSLPTSTRHRHCSQGLVLPGPGARHHRHVRWAATATQPEIATQQQQPAASSDAPRISQYVPQQKQTYASPKITETGTLRPSPLWYPAWMKYRRREDNYVFWQDKFSRNSMDIAYEERRWTLFSTIWYLVMQTYFKAIPPALRYVAYLLWYPVQMKLYQAHKLLVLAQCQLEARLAAEATGETASRVDSIKQLPLAVVAAVSAYFKDQRARASKRQAVAASRARTDQAEVEAILSEAASLKAIARQQADAAAGSSSSTATSSSASMGASAASSGAGQAGQSGASQQEQGQAGGQAEVSQRVGPGFSKTMALRRLHWKNTLLAEILYLINVYKTGRVHMLPPKKKPLQRPTLFFLF